MITSVLANFISNTVVATKFTYASLGVVYGNMLSVQGDAISSNIWDFYEDTLQPIFNTIIIVLAIFGAFKVIMKLVQGDEGAGKLIIIILGGLLIWFAILPLLLSRNTGDDMFGSN